MAVIKRIGVLKASCFSGLFNFFMGFIFTIFMWIFSLIISSLITPGIESLDATGTASAVSNVGFSWTYFIFFPLISGIIGFIAGVILFPIMNLILKITKGIDLDLELNGKTY